MKMNAFLLGQFLQNRLDLTLGNLEWILSWEKKRVEFLSPEYETSLKSKINDLMQGLQLTRELDILENEYILIPKVKAYYEDVLALTQMNEQELLGKLESIRTERKDFKRELKSKMNQMSSIDSNDPQNEMFINSIFYKQALPLSQKIQLNEALEKELIIHLQKYDSPYSRLSLLFTE